jgi:hypothetical protein
MSMNSQYIRFASEFNGLVITANTGVITTGTWQGSSISTTYTDAKVVSVDGSTGVVDLSSSYYPLTGGGLTGNIRASGYLRVGSVSAPTNVSNGDITGVRGFFSGSSNLAMSLGSDQIMAKMLHIHTSTANAHMYISGTAPAISFGSTDALASLADIGFVTASSQFVTGSVAGDLVLRTTQSSTSMRFALGAGPTLVALLSGTGNFAHGGYLNVGSTGTPSNTTAGDINASRLSLGSGSFGLGGIIRVTGSVTNTASGATAPVSIAITVAPASNSSSEFRALNFGNVPNAGAFTLSTLTGGHFEGSRIGSTQSGVIAVVNGANINGLIIDSNSYANVTATTARGIGTTAISRPSGNSTVTVTNIIGVDVTSAGSGRIIGTAITGFVNQNPTTLATGTSLIGFENNAVFNTSITGVSAGFRTYTPVASGTENYGLNIRTASSIFLKGGTTTHQHGIGVGITTYTHTGGEIATLNATPTVAGSGYAVGDRLTITSNGTLAEINVDSVDGSGGVTGVSLISGGQGYVVATGRVTAYDYGFTGGGSLGTNNGSGCTVNITAVTLSKTLTNAASIYIEGAPVASTNVTITNGPYSLWVDSGTSRFDGNVAIGGVTSASSILTVLTSSNTVGVQIQRNATALNSTAVLGFSNTTTEGITNHAEIYAIRTDDLASADTTLTFRVRTNSVMTEYLRLKGSGSIGISDAINIDLGTTTGTKIGTATTQKLSFWNATPIVQPTTGVAEATFTENAGGTAINVDSTFGGYTLQQVVQALQSIGLLA